MNRYEITYFSYFAYVNTICTVVVQASNAVNAIYASGAAQESVINLRLLGSVEIQNLSG